MSLFNRRTLVLALAAQASPALAWQESGKIRLILRVPNRQIVSRGNLPIIAQVQARAVCAMIVSGDFAADGFKLHVVGPDGAQHQPSGAPPGLRGGRRAPPASPQARTLGAGSIYEAKHTLDGREIFQIKGPYLITVSYTPPDRAELTARHGGEAMARISRVVDFNRIPLLTVEDAMLSETVEVRLL